jgi:hypothetical protein
MKAIKKRFEKAYTDEMDKQRAEEEGEKEKAVIGRRNIFSVDRQNMCSPRRNLDVVKERCPYCAHRKAFQKPGRKQCCRCQKTWF